MLVFSLVFFFSSRRRHTRYWRDWSSDVCSSDLMSTGRWSSGYLNDQRPVLIAVDGAADALLEMRSEERRVGKECRSRWRPSHYKEKNTLTTPTPRAAPDSQTRTHRPTR